MVSWRLVTTKASIWLEVRERESVGQASQSSLRIKHLLPFSHGKTQLTIQVHDYLQSSSAAGEN